MWLESGEKERIDIQQIGGVCTLQVFSNSGTHSGDISHNMLRINCKAGHFRYVTIAAGIKLLIFKPKKIGRTTSYLDSLN